MNGLKRTKFRSVRGRGVVPEDFTEPGPGSDMTVLVRHSWGHLTLDGLVPA